MAGNMSTDNPFGDNVIILDPSLSAKDMATALSKIPSDQDLDSHQFDTGRYAILLKPGVPYENLNIKVGYYTTVHGLGETPDQVTVNGTVQCWPQSTLDPAPPPTDTGSALNNFWRGVENLKIAVPPTPGINVWAVSQATFLRRVHIDGQLFLWDYFKDYTKKNFSSGGYMADSTISGAVIAGSQQQFFTRNSTFPSFDGGVWNYVFVGCEHQKALPTSWPPFTDISQSPVIREKPFLTFDGTNYSVQVPALWTNKQGLSWPVDPSDEHHQPRIIPISNFYVARPSDSSATLNTKLAAGTNVIFTPGIYQLSGTIHVTRPGTVLLGLGMATLVSDTGLPILLIDDVDDVSVSGLIFEAGSVLSSAMVVIGSNTSSVDHSKNPTALYDICCRVGGEAAGSTRTCVIVNSNNVILDNLWLWRADHDRTGSQSSDAVGWTVNPATSGLVVNGSDVTAYGLFVEHFQGYQTLWNGNNGRVYFYQSEMPYDVPAQEIWAYPSYKVGEQVVSHTAVGLGVYCFFTSPFPIQAQNAIETPIGQGIQMSHMTTVWLNGTAGSRINHIANNEGDFVTKPATGDGVMVKVLN